MPALILGCKFGFLDGNAGGYCQQETGSANTATRLPANIRFFFSISGKESSDYSKWVILGCSRHRHHRAFVSWSDFYLGPSIRSPSELGLLFSLVQQVQTGDIHKQGSETICLPAGMGWLLLAGIDRLKCSNTTHPRVLEKHREPDTHLESNPWLCPRIENIIKSIENRAEVG